MRRQQRPWPGWFITFEGVDGAGKTTQLRALGQFLRQQGRTVVETREPGGTDLSEKVRELLLDPRNENMADRTELLLIAAARAQHVEERIRPALERGEIVLCDRFADATIAYQAAGRGLPARMVEELNDLATQDVRPDVTFLLDIDPAVSRRRVSTRAGAQTRFEGEPVAFFQRVRDAYLKNARADLTRFVVLDASGSIGVVQAKIRKMLRQRGAIDG